MIAHADGTPEQPRLSRRERANVVAALYDEIDRRRRRYETTSKAWTGLLLGAVVGYAFGPWAVATAAVVLLCYSTLYAVAVHELRRVHRDRESG